MHRVLEKTKVAIDRTAHPQPKLALSRDQFAGIPRLRLEAVVGCYCPERPAKAKSAEQGREVNGSFVRIPLKKSALLALQNPDSLLLIGGGFGVDARLMQAPSSGHFTNPAVESETIELAQWN